MTPLSVVVLTQGDRPEQLAAACRSVVSALPGSPVEFVLVWNTGDESERAPLDLGPNAIVINVRPGRNLGIPGGRNRGVLRATSAIVLFLDDDARVLGRQLTTAVDRFTSESSLGVVALRLVDERGTTLQRHVPRLGARSAQRAGPVTSFLGGASLHRRSAFEQVGGYAEPFMYAMEETDLALRLIDAGWSVWYEPTVQVFHPRTIPGRHPGAVEQTARNRVWLAYRNLPTPLATAYVVIWSLVTTARNVTESAVLRAHWRGTWEGIRNPIGPRRPISWRTAWRLTRLGRPPII